MKNTRIAIEEIVSSIRPLDNLEQKHIQFALRWIQSGADIFRVEKPATPDPHLVSYFVIIDYEKKSILLVDPNQGERWFPTGGHVEFNEHPKDTVKREVFEELGIEADFLVEEPLFLTVTKSIWFTAKHTDVSLWYLLKADRDSEFNVNKMEMSQICWFGIDQVPYERSDPHLKRFIEKIKIFLSQ